MKTAISIPDDLFAEAEAVAKRLGYSRSQLYALAVAEYLSTYGERGVTETLDEVYATRDSRLDTALERMQSASIPKEDW